MELFLYKSINDPSGSFSRVTTTLEATCRDQKNSLRARHLKKANWKSCQVNFIQKVEKERKMLLFSRSMMRSLPLVVTMMVSHLFVFNCSFCISSLLFCTL